MIRCNEKMLHEIIFFQIRSSLHALATAFLLTIQRYRHALDIPCLRHGDDNIFIGNKILNINVFRCAGNLGTARRAEALLDFHHLFFDDAAHQGVVFQNALVVFDLFAQFLQLRFNLFAFQAGQTAQLHFQDGIALTL